VAGSCECGTEPPGSIKCGKFQSDHHRLCGPRVIFVLSKTQKQYSVLSNHISFYNIAILFTETYKLRIIKSAGLYRAA
jgi:hypothetical protein